MENEDIKFIKEMQVLDVKDGDILVFKSESKLSYEAINRFKEAVSEYLNLKERNIKCIFLDEGITVGVLRKQ